MSKVNGRPFCACLSCELWIFGPPTLGFNRHAAITDAWNRRRQRKDKLIYSPKAALENRFHRDPGWSSAVFHASKRNAA